VAPDHLLPSFCKGGLPVVLCCVYG
jgi:hypothetical protein